MSANEIRIVDIGEVDELVVLFVHASLERMGTAPMLKEASIGEAEFAVTAYRAHEPGTIARAAIQDGEIVGLVCARLMEIGVDHPGYTYLPESFVNVAVSGWHFRDAAALDHLPRLLEPVRFRARELGITRLSVDTRAGDWLGQSAWAALGLRKDNVLAGRTSKLSLSAPLNAVDVREARAEDIEAIVGLTFEQYAFHADFTRSGMRADQVAEPTRRMVEELLDPTTSSACFVALVHGEVVACISSYALSVSDGLPATAWVPRSHGYIGLASVSPLHRSAGIGRSLVVRVMQQLSDSGHEYVLLNYTDDNHMSRSFWQSHGFTTITESFTGHIL
ncbi:GNAT family N-acetyltransferase [Humidisolicoccus flavus]|uniref:GNAT family N-acetyltransferase n=1 Tax=Humidisolicoccus flavus TaxID=3111414 RepID=UPI00324A34DC